MRRVVLQVPQTVDQLCRAEYGDESGHVERVLAANPGLAERPVLPAGTEVVLPGAPAAADTVPVVTLWD